MHRAVVGETMRLQFASAGLIAVAALALGAGDTPRGINDVSTSNLDQSGRYDEAAKHDRFIALSDDYSGRQAAEFRLADMRFKGGGVAKNPTESLRFMQQATQGPDASWRRLANYRLGDLNEPAPLVSNSPTLPTLIVAQRNPSSLAAAEPKYSLVDLFASLSPSVVRIVALDVVKGEKSKLKARGSAVVIQPNLMLTNCHVLKGNAVGTLIDKKVLFVRRVGGDDALDLCLLRPNKPFTAIKNTRSYETLRVGEKVFAIGSPSGLENTLTEGIISGLRTRKDVRLIQTSTPIYPGSSGGGLFDEDGALIGITTFGKAGTNLNFAVALDESAPIIARAK